MKIRRTLCGVGMVAIFGLLATLCAPNSASAEATEQQILVDNAVLTFKDFMADENMGWIKQNLAKCKGILIVPRMLKAGFIVGGSGGNGLLLVRDAKTGQWSQPGFYTIGSVTFGLQIGGEAAQVIMVVRTQGALDSLLSTSVKLGGDISIAVGPVGAGAKGVVTADIVSFSRTKGAYAGINLEGAVISVKDKWNKAYYGKPVRPTDIFVKESVSNPGSAELRNAIEKAQ